KRDWSSDVCSSDLLFLHGYHCHAVGAALGGQVKIHNLRKLLAQNGHKHFVHGHTEHGGLIGWAACIGAVVNGGFALGNAFHGKHGEAFHFVVVTCVVAKSAFIGVVVCVDYPFKHNFS